MAPHENGGKRKEGPFPSLYKNKKPINQNYSFEMPTNEAIKAYHIKDMVQETRLGESLNKSQDLRRHKPKRASEQLLTMSRYQRTGGGYNRSILLNMIS